MKPSTRFAPALVAALALAAFAGSASAMSSPILDFTAGRAFGGNGNPNDGGVSASFSPMWVAGGRTRFGVVGFADDIGTVKKPFVDQAAGAVIGTVADAHRMSYGLAWRADHDVLIRRRWSAGVGALAGWWRVADDLRGQTLNAASAVGFAIGADVRKRVTVRHEAGLAVRWQKLTSDSHAGYRRVDHYATAALEWRWTTVSEER